MQGGSSRSWNPPTFPLAKRRRSKEVAVSDNSEIETVTADSGSVVIIPISLIGVATKISADKGGLVIIVPEGQTPEETAGLIQAHHAGRALRDKKSDAKA